MSYTKLLPFLLQDSLAIPCLMKPLESPYSSGYIIMQKVIIMRGVGQPMRKSVEDMKTPLKAIFEEMGKLVEQEAKSYQDMSSLDASIVEHKLPLKPKWSPIKQKLRWKKLELSLKIREEVKKQFDVGFIMVSKYPQWVATIVLVSKKDGKVQICVDY
ncbi:hypothetical protein CR513_30289, partial [Mucuna pruriens]